MEVMLTVELLFDEFVSGVELLAVAVLVSAVPLATSAATRALIVNCALAPAGSEGIVQLTFGAGALHVAGGPVFWMTPTNTTPSGKVSLNVAPAAASGPAFVRLIV